MLPGWAPAEDWEPCGVNGCYRKTSNFAISPLLDLYAFLFHKWLVNVPIDHTHTHTRTTRPPHTNSCSALAYCKISFYLVGPQDIHSNTKLCTTLRKMAIYEVKKANFGGQENLNPVKSCLLFHSHGRQKRTYLYIQLCILESIRSTLSGGPCALGQQLVGPDQIEDGCSGFSSYDSAKVATGPMTFLWVFLRRGKYPGS